MYHLRSGHLAIIGSGQHKPRRLEIQAGPRRVLNGHRNLSGGNVFRSEAMMQMLLNHNATVDYGYKEAQKGNGPKGLYLCPLTLNLKEFTALPALVRT